MVDKISFVNDHFVDVSTTIRYVDFVISSPAIHWLIMSQAISTFHISVDNVSSLSSGSSTKKKKKHTFRMFSLSCWIPIGQDATLLGDIYDKRTCILQSPQHVAAHWHPGHEEKWIFFLRSLEPIALNSPPLILWQLIHSFSPCLTFITSTPTFLLFLPPPLTTITNFHSFISVALRYAPLHLPTHTPTQHLHPVNPQTHWQVLFHTHASTHTHNL